MNLKKMIISLITVVLVAMIALQNAVYAKVLPEGINMGIIELMENNTPHMGYSINEPGTTNAAKIWNIVRYNSETTYENVNMYCLKAGVGFVETDTNGVKKRPYNITFDMKKEKEEILWRATGLGNVRTIRQTRCTQFHGGRFSLHRRSWLPPPCMARRNRGAAETDALRFSGR